MTTEAHTQPRGNEVTSVSTPCGQKIVKLLLGKHLQTCQHPECKKLKEKLRQKQAN